ncbi:TonB-dependent receptor plug domain-containing protein [Sphingopyxis flava]|uniref:Vitamin B12 transporter n=1 Tax=Sphingopyxis flava TaxID=1507287 RepID=A0A1T5F6M5_9SPHN|nr:TonB-dependent receptor [Sphingopyxis flava]SKB91793.1 vitamin B12 transporter [Sphingopyxis flava]
MKKLAYKTSLSLLALAAASPALAHEAPFDDQSITVIGAPLALSETNASVSIIDKEEIDRAQNGAAADLIARLPGVHVTQNGALGGVASLRIRGAEDAQTLVVIDGVRVGDPSSPNGAFDFANLMLGSIDRIEVLRGANSLPWGSQAIGGVVSVTSTDPDLASGTSGRVGAEYGARDTVRVNGQLRTAALGASQFGIGGGYVRTRGFSSAAAGTERDGYRQYSANLSNRTEIGSTLLFRAFGLYAASRVELDGFAPPTFTFGDTDEFQKTKEHYAAASLEHRPAGTSGADGFAHRLQFAFADVNRDNFNPDFGDAPTFRARGRSERLSYSLDWGLGDVFGSAAGDSLRLIAGAEREWTRALTDDGFAPDRGQTATTGGWAMLAARPTETFSLTAGVRRDDHRDFGGATSFAADIGQKIGNDVLLRASYREGFKAPTLFQLSDSSGAYGNPELLPERAKSYEVGVRLGDARRFVDVAWYRRDSRNLIDFVSCPPVPDPLPAICASGNRPFGTYDNINRARAEGVEVEAGAKLGSSFAVRANYSLTVATDRTPGSPLEGNRLARRPRHLANAELAWAPDGASGADLSVAVRYAGKSFDDRANSVRLGDYVVVDLRASYPLAAGIELFGRVENLFDEEYQTVATYNTAGRSAYVGARWGF